MQKHSHEQEIPKQINDNSLDESDQNGCSTDNAEETFLVHRLDPLVSSQVELKLSGWTQEREGTLEYMKVELEQVPNKGDDTLDTTQSGKCCRSKTSETGKTLVARVPGQCNRVSIFSPVTSQQPSKHKSSSATLNLSTKH